MQKILIHAGCPRTGTKSVQQSLMALDGEDYLYAPLSGIAGFPSHSRILRNLFTPPETRSTPNSSGMSARPPFPHR